MRTSLCLWLIMTTLVAAETRLVQLEQTVLGWKAVVRPEWDYTVAQPRSFEVMGDTEAFSQLGSGLVTLDGEFDSHRVQLPTLRVAARPTQEGSWRGTLRGLNRGGGRVFLPALQQEVTLKDAPAGRFSVTAIFALEAARLKASNATFSPWAPSGDEKTEAALVAALSESFLTQCAREYLYGHQKELSWTEPQTASRVALSDLGLTLLDCEPGEVRLFGELTGEVVGSSAVAHFSTRARLELDRGDLALHFLPGTECRLTHPWPAPVPAAWLGWLENTVFQTVGDRLKLPVPSAYIQDLVASGVVGRQEFDKVRLITVPGPDRRANYVTVALGEGPSVSLRRLPSTGFRLWLSEPLVTAALTQKVPPLLPQKIAIPESQRPREQVFIFTLEVPAIEVKSLALAYSNGLLKVNDCLLDIHWKAGPLAGVEPGARLAGEARLRTLSTDPLRLSLQPSLNSIQFLSPRILDKSSQEQEALRQRVASGVGALDIPLPLPPRLPLPPLSGRAGLELTSFESEEDGLILNGKLLP